MDCIQEALGIVRPHACRCRAAPPADRPSLMRAHSDILYTRQKNLRTFSFSSLSEPAATYICIYIDDIYVSLSLYIDTDISLSIYLTPTMQPRLHLGRLPLASQNHPGSNHTSAIYVMYIYI